MRPSFKARRPSTEFKKIYEAERRDLSLCRIKTNTGEKNKVFLLRFKIYRTFAFTAINDL